MTMQLTEKQKSDGWRIVKFGAITDWKQSRIALKQQTNKLFESLKELGY